MKVNRCNAEAAPADSRPILKVALADQPEEVIEAVRNDEVIHDEKLDAQRLFTILGWIW